VTVPFVDVGGNIFFCQIVEAYASGLTNGTDATHYSPSQNVPREQMAAFITRTQDSALRRGSRRAALGQWWTPTPALGLPSTTVGIDPVVVKSDGADLWVANAASATISRVRASDGRLLETWTGANSIGALLVTGGSVYAASYGSPNGALYVINPAQPPGPVSTVTTSVGGGIIDLAFDGARIWTSNNLSQDFSIVSFGIFGTNVTNITNSIVGPAAIIYDGSNMWATDSAFPQRICKLDPSDGHVLLSLPVGQTPEFPVFDGTNIWVPNQISNSVTVVKVSTGTLLATLTGNGLNHPYGAAFDGERIGVTNLQGGTISLWNATDLTPLGSFPTGFGDRPQGLCSDGLSFWITIPSHPSGSSGRLARF
jgi:hypothetical protein